MCWSVRESICTAVLAACSQCRHGLNVFLRDLSTQFEEHDQRYSAHWRTCGCHYWSIVWKLRTRMNNIEKYWIKLRGARSRLYGRRFLQVNTRWKALVEIYTMHSFAPFFKLKISAKNRQHFFRDWISDFFQYIRRFLHFFCKFWWFFFRISRQIPEKTDVCRFSISFAVAN